RHTRSTRDWSSDVCSSDLSGERIAPLRAQLIGNIFIPAGKRNRLESDRLNLVDVLRRELDDLTDGIVVDAVDDRHHQRDFDADEIGRASCRERCDVWGGVA